MSQLDVTLVPEWCFASSVEPTLTVHVRPRIGVGTVRRINGRNNHREPQWLVLVWRLPTGSSAHRVAAWRKLRYLGAVGLTPGAAILPYTEDSQEQLDWLAQEISDNGGDAWVLPVSRLAAGEERQIRDKAASEREMEYRQLRDEAEAFLRRAEANLLESDDYPARLRIDRELLALQRRFHKIGLRDFFGAAGRRETAAVINRCLRFRQGVSRKLETVKAVGRGAGRIA
jgi:hypothetical protein